MGISQRSWLSWFFPSPHSTRHKPPKVKVQMHSNGAPIVGNAIRSSTSIDPSVDLIPILSVSFQDYDRGSDTIKACILLRPMSIPIKVRNGPCNSFYPASYQIALWSSLNYQKQLLPKEKKLDTIAKSLQKISGCSNNPWQNEQPTKESKKEISNRWEKIPDIIQQMILKLSSVNDISFAPALCKTYQQILKQNKALGTTMIINILLSTMGCQVETTASLANAIRTGNFRANSQQVAHPFSIFNVPYIDAANMTCFNQTELELLQSKGEGIPKDIVKKLSENKFKAPTSTHLLRRQFNNWQGILQLCFGQS